MLIGRQDGPEEERVLVARVQARVWVNGTPLGLGIRVLRDRDLSRSMGALGRRKAERYAWCEIARRLESLYLELLAKRERIPLAS